MNNFTFYSPTYFIFGKDTENQVGQYVKKYGGSKVLIHYGGNSIKRSGLLDRVKLSLDEEKIPYIELGGVCANPRSDLVYEGIRIAKEEGIDFLLPVGGGSVMDSAKAIALGAVYDGDFWDFYTGKTVEGALPVGTIVTLAASGSEASTDSVITKIDGDKLYKRCADGDILRPKFAIMNPELTQTLPPYQTASGIIDIIAHCMERYFSDTEGVGLTDRLLEGIMLDMIAEGRRVMADPNDYDARANIMWAAMVAHNNITGVGRAQDWGTHHLENELSSAYQCSHGAGLGILFPSWMRYACEKKGPMKFAKFAVNVFGCQMNYENPTETALCGIKAYENFIKELNMPTSISSIGGKAEDVAMLVENMFFGAPNHGSFIKLTPEIAAQIYKMAM